MSDTNFEAENQPNPLDSLVSLTRQSAGEIVDSLEPGEGYVDMVRRNLVRVVDQALRASSNGVSSEQIIEAVNSAASDPLST